MHKRKQPAVYIMASQRNGTIYTGVTADLARRVFEHRNGKGSAFTAQNVCRKLVWYALYEDMITAISEEKRIKSGSRKKKLVLIETMNPQWQDLYENLA